MDDRTTIELRRPVAVGGVETASLTMRRAKARDLRDAKRGAAGNEDAEIRLFANLCEVEPGVVEELDMADYLRLSGAYSAFLDSP